MKLAAIDLDGTLLNSQHQLLEKNTRALRQAQAQGIQLVLATGRSVVSAVDMLEQMELEGFILALNGTFIAQKTSEGLKTLRSSQLEQSDVKKAFDLAQEEKITFIASNQLGSDRVVMDGPEELVQEFLVKRADLRCFTAKEMQEKIDDARNYYLKLAFTNQNRKKLLSLKQRLEKAGLPTIFSDTHYIEYVPQGVNKGTALQFLCEKLGISLSETLAIGDQENDIELLQMSGRGIAMGNAQEHVKAVADQVTATNDQAGVAKALLRYL